LNLDTLSGDFYKAVRINMAGANPPEWDRYRVLRSRVYEVVPKLLIETAEGVEVEHSVWSERNEDYETKSIPTVRYEGFDFDREKMKRRHLLLPGQSLRITYVYDVGKARCWFYKRGATPGRSPIGADYTYGAVFQATSPQIDVYKLNPAPAHEMDSISAFDNQPTHRLEPISLEDKFVYSTSDNHDDWKTEYEIPASLRKIDFEEDPGQDFKQVCRTNEHFQR
ncbi:MAG: hypothetical protein AAF202_10775, partial [Pseudomonadota bacterium]